VPNFSGHPLYKPHATQHTNSTYLRIVDVDIDYTWVKIQIDLYTDRTHNCNRLNNSRTSAVYY